MLRESQEITSSIEKAQASRRLGTLEALALEHQKVQCQSGCSEHDLLILTVSGVPVLQHDSFAKKKSAVATVLRIMLMICVTIQRI